MDTSSTNPEPVQTHFLKKFLGGRTDTTSDKDLPNNLAESIIHQTEKNSHTSQSGANGSDPDNNSSATLITIAHATLTLVILAAIGAWLYFFAMLDTGNSLYAKFGKQNLTTQLIETQTLHDNLTTSLTNTKRFSAYLEAENFSNQVLGLNLEDTTLRYQSPNGELVEKINRDTGIPELVYRVVDENGRLVDIPKATILAKENTKTERSASYQAALIQILEKANQLQTEQISNQLKNAELKTNFDRLISSLLRINTAELQTGNPNFPTRFTRNQYGEARSAAKSIRTNIKAANLQNLIVDLKKQVETIDLTGADAATRATIQNLTEIISKISAKRTSSFETALTAASQLNFDTLKPKTVADQVAEIIAIKTTNNTGASTLSGDLATAAELARNLGAVTIISQLDSTRIEWSKRIDQIGTIARYGSDGVRDGETTPTNANRDIDLSNDLVVFTGYSGKSKEEKIITQGRVIGRDQYRNLNFTLLADLLDALAGSTNFRDITGFSFSKNKNPKGQLYVPFNIELTLQKPDQTDPADVPTTTETPVAVETPTQPTTTEPVTTVATPGDTTDVPATTETPAQPTTTEPVTKEINDPFAAPNSIPVN